MQVELCQCVLQWGSCQLKRFHADTKLKDALCLSGSEAKSVLQFGKKICHENHLLGMQMACYY